MESIANSLKWFIPNSTTTTTTTTTSPSSNSIEQSVNSSAETLSDVPHDDDVNSKSNLASESSAHDTTLSSVEDTNSSAVATPSNTFNYSFYEFGSGNTVRISQTNPFDMYYEVHGHGPNKLILLAGLGANCRFWDTFVASLLETNLFTICILDNRG